MAIIYNHTTNNITADSGNVSINGAVPSAGGGSSTKTIANKTAAYTVVAADLGKIINCTAGTFTISLTAAATLGSGFTCTIWNTSIVSTHAITIDPNASETIDYCDTRILRTGEGFTIVCDGTNWQIDNKKPMKGYAENFSNLSSGAIASGSYGVRIGSEGSSTGAQAYAIGHQAVASSTDSYSIGRSCTASGYASHSIGNSCTAASNYSTALGTNSAASGSVTAIGAGAMALGGSYASGQDGFAAAVVTNTNTYGATGFGSIALGRLTQSSGNHTIALGRGAISSGGLAISTDDGTGMFATSTKTYAVAIGGWAHATLIGQYSFASGGFGSYGDAQYSKMVLRAQTTTTTSVVLTSDAGAASAINQVVAKNGQCIAVKGTLIGHNFAGGLTNQAVVYDISCVLLSDGNSGGVSLHDSSVLTRLGTDGIGITTVPTLSVNTTYNALTITSGNKAATNIRWVATVHLTMVT
jgi:hypothetical protein